MITLLISDEESAEQSCEKQVQHALEMDPRGLDGLQTLASLRLSQDRTGDATAAVEAVYHRIVAIRDVIRSRTVIDELRGVDEPAEFQGVVALPVMDCLMSLQIIRSSNFASPPLSF